VVAEGLKVLQAAAAKHQFALDLSHYDLGGDRYLRTGEILPASAVEELKGFDSIYLGAIGHPDVEPASSRRAFSSASASSWTSTSTCVRCASTPASRLR